MIPVWVIALIAALGAVCLALPLHIGMTGVCLLLLAAVLYLGLMWVCGAKILRECLAFVKLKF